MLVFSWQLCLLNDYHKECCKIGHGHMVTHLTTTATYDHNCRLTYGHKLRTTYSSIKYYIQKHSCVYIILHYSIFPFGSFISQDKINRLVMFISGDYMNYSHSFFCSSTGTKVIFSTSQSSVKPWYFPMFFRPTNMSDSSYLFEISNCHLHGLTWYGIRSELKQSKNTT